MSQLHCPSLYQYVRRNTREVMVGSVGVGGNNPIRIQSMLTADTLDTAGCVKEALALAEAGCEIIRLTAQTKVYAANLEHIARELRAAGCHVPLVADIHFKPDAAMEAAKWVEKIRINPGNFIDKKKFAERDYTDSEYEAELERIREAFTPLVQFCKENGRAMRLGANHGSLSDRILNRYGDTPDGMVESALEFARVARELNYNELIFSMKSSNVKVMIAAYRLLAKRMAEESLDYPIHLGVTEAGEGEDARIKSAIGIGSLLADGIGDTLRISLTEDPVYEVAPGFEIAKPFHIGTERTKSEEQQDAACFDPFLYSKRKADLITTNGMTLGWNEPVRMMLPREAVQSLNAQEMGDFMPELAYEESAVQEVNPCDTAQLSALADAPACLVTVADGTPMPLPQAFRLLAARIPTRHSILLKDTLNNGDPSEEMSPAIAAGLNMGSLLVDGIGNAVLIRRENKPAEAAKLGFNVLQAAGVRISKAEYVSCPSCGRTLYNIQEAAARIRAATEHLKGVKIAIMGCIVNGPGEMSDADFGYVGGAPNKINLYVGHTPVELNIPQEEAVDRLIELIKSHNRWIPA